MLIPRQVGSWFVVLSSPAYGRYTSLDLRIQYLTAYHKQTSRARSGASATGARRTGTTASRGGGANGARTAAKKSAQAGAVAKVVRDLKGELGTALEAAMEKLEAGCDGFGEGTKLDCAVFWEACVPLRHGIGMPWFSRVADDPRSYTRERGRQATPPRCRVSFDVH